MSAARGSSILGIIAPEGSGKKSELGGNGKGNGNGHRRTFTRVPTHVIGVAQERRLYPRAALHLPVELKRVAGRPETNAGLLRTRDISSSGVCFLSPTPLEPGTSVELEIYLVYRPLGRGSVRMTTEAHVVRSEPADSTGLHGVAVEFDDIRFTRDDLAHQSAGLPR